MIMDMSVNVSLRRISFPLEAMNLVTSSTIVIAYMFLNRMMYMIDYENVPPPTHTYIKNAHDTHTVYYAYLLRKSTIVL